MTPTVYLAGPITGLSYDEGQDWRTYVVGELRPYITAFSPLRCKDYLRERGLMDAMGYEDKALSSPKGITTRDRWDCQRCDLVLANVVGAKTVSIGTVMEIAWADSVRTPIVLACEEGNPHVHAMLTHAAGFVVPTLEEALEIVQAVLLP